MTPPFDPGFGYPEYPWKGSVSREPNHAYAAVRRSLELLGLDRENLGTGAWNPLRDTVRPGDLVLLKPNLVCENREGRPDQWEQIVTSASVVRAVLDYVLIALSGEGRVVIADSPQTDSDFDLTVDRTGLRAMAEEISGRACTPIELLDLRKERWTVHDGVCTGSIPLAGDPLGAVRIDLGGKSHFMDSPGTAAFYGASYDSDETNLSHSGGRHVYEISGTALAADAIINIPKLKTHKKCGMTGCLKGMVGLAGNKNLLPHYRFGSPSGGGDQFPDGRRNGPLENALVGRAKRLLLHGGSTTRSLIGALKPIGYRLFGSTHHVVRSGNWSGNDTIWRTVLDLATIMTYGDSGGIMREEPARRFFNFVDGIVGGEGNGPLDAEPRPARLLVAGASPLVVDAVSAVIAGMGPCRLPLIAKGFSSPFGLAPCSPDRVRTVLHSDGTFCEGLEAVPVLEDLKPHFAWGGASR
jgi:uncharacterized protein (DUF362 family)